MTELKVALIGAGNIARAHADAYASVEGARLTTIVAPTLSRAQSLAAQHGAVALADYRELLSDPQIDAFDICTPVDTHEQIAVLALEAGKHVSCQKPLALTLEACARVAQAAERSGKTLVVPYMHRHSPLTVEIKRLVEAGSIGRPVRAHYQMSCARGGFPDWFYDEARSGGVFVDTLTHGTNFFNWLFGKPSSVSGLLGSSGLPGQSDDNAAMIADYDGVIASLAATWTAPPSYPNIAMEIIGTKGALRFSTPTGTVLYHRLETVDETGTITKESASRGHVEKAQHFVDLAIGRSVQPVSTAQAAIEALEVALQARDAARGA